MYSSRWIPTWFVVALVIIGAVSQPPAPRLRHANRDPVRQAANERGTANARSPATAAEITNTNEGAENGDQEPACEGWLAALCVVLASNAWVAAFTGALAILGYLQYQATNRQAEHFLATERPYLIIQPSNTAGGVTITDQIGRRIRDPAPSAAPPLAAEYTITNAGRSPALITGRRAAFTTAETPQVPFAHERLAKRSDIPIGPGQTRTFTADERAMSNIGTVWRMLARQQGSPVQVLRFHAIVEYRASNLAQMHTSHCAYVYEYDDGGGVWQVIDALPECNIYT